jgi:hypothetical protein
MSKLIFVLISPLERTSNWHESLLNLNISYDSKLKKKPTKSNQHLKPFERQAVSLKHISPATTPCAQIQLRHILMCSRKKLCPFDNSSTLDKKMHHLH